MTCKDSSIFCDISNRELELGVGQGDEPGGFDQCEDKMRSFGVHLCMRTIRGRLEAKTIRSWLVGSNPPLGRH